MVFEKIKKIIAEQTGCDEDEIALEMQFVDDLGMDAIDLLELALAIEDEFDIDIPDDVAAGFSTVGEVVEYIKEAM